MTSPFYPSPELHSDLRAWFSRSLIFGIVLSVLSVIGAFFDPGDFFRSYLMGYLFWLGIALGALGIVMLQYLTAGAWGIMTRRTLESATRTSRFWRCFSFPSLSGSQASTIGRTLIWFTTSMYSSIVPAT